MFIWSPLSNLGRIFFSNRELRNSLLRKVRHLHHLCQGEFESKFQDVLDNIDSIVKRCLPCLLLENASFAEEVCKEIGCTMKGATELEWPNLSSRVEPSPGQEGSVTRRISLGASPIANSTDQES